MSAADRLSLASPTVALEASALYWEQRAQRFAARGEGLAAVCSYGMPEFYNRMIQLTQRLSLAPWLRVSAGTRVLDLGCGVGRWSRLLAARGARVSGIDLSATMIELATRHARESGLSQRCRFLVEDLAQLDLGSHFDLVLGVTVLQHILEPARLERATARIAAHLAPGGRAVLLEAAPASSVHRCDTAVFTARERGRYVELFARHGLRVRALGGVDPAPFKTWLLPYLRDLPRGLRTAAVAATCAASLPIDVLLGRRAVARSWHVVFVLEREG